MWSHIVKRTALVVATAAVSLVGGSIAQAAPRLVRLGTAPALPALAPTAPLAPATNLNVTVELQPQDPAGLQALATAISTPGSPEFRQYLTVPQFAARFGATPTAIAAVESDLRATGLTVGQVTANDLTIPVTGTAAQVDKTFSVQMDSVQLKGRTAFANTQAPALPASVAGYVQGIVGLNDLILPQSAGLETSRGLSRGSGEKQFGTLGRALPFGPGFGAKSGSVNPAQPQVLTGGPQPCPAATAQEQTWDQMFGGSPELNAVTADQVATAYGFPSLYLAGDEGAGQTVALFEEQPFNPSDITTYEGCYQVSTTITPVNVDGGPGPYQAPPGSGDGESSLDIEQVIGLAPKANILVYQGPPDGSGILQIFSTMVSQNVAKVISSSFGVCESATGGSVIQGENTLLQEAAAQGQSFFASSGDSGAETCSQLGKGDFSLSVEDPSAQPFATGVGGTSLTAEGPPPSEGVWDDGPNPECNCTGDRIGGGSGGGISTQWPMPSYQSSAPSALGVINSDSSHTPCGSSSFCREDPDVSADADLLTGYVVYSDGAWSTTGGTSASTPLWAAFAALTNASTACRGQVIGFANPALYQIAGSSYRTNFNDITAASPFTTAPFNDTLNAFGVSGGDPSNLFPVTNAYDMATGIGSPIGATLAGSLCVIASPVYTVSVTSPGTITTGRGVPVSVQIASSDSGSQALGLTATGLPAGLAISPAGLIAGTPSTAGANTVTVSASDKFHNAGTTTFTWNVVTPGGPKGSASGKRGKLSFSLSPGSFAPAFSSVTIKLPKGLKFGKTKKIKVTSGGSKVAFKLKVKGGTLTLSFSAAIPSVSISFGKGSIKGTLTGKRKKHAKVTVTLGSAGISETSTIPLKL